MCCDKAGLLTVNGTAIKEPYIYAGNKPSELNFDVTVPKGKFWVMGDHRNASVTLDITKTISIKVLFPSHALLAELLQ